MKNKIYVLTFLIFLFTFSLLLIIKNPSLLDRDERRYLAKKPEITKESIVNSEIYNDIDEYYMDQFPFRSYFRKAKSVMNYDIFKKNEYDGIILKNGIAIKTDFNFSYDNIKKTSLKINSFINNELKENNIYFVLVPDKNCLINNVNYDKCFKIIEENTNAKMIPIKLTLDDYYKYDSHWNQKSIISTSEDIMKAMGNQIHIEYEEKKIENFQGIYSSNAALKKYETLSYLTNEEIENAEVFHYDTNKYSKVYDIDKLNDEKSLDMYDIFLSGATPILKIKNTEIDNGKTLLLFRDSYGSSIAPLFINCYENIYLIDLRYIASNYIGNFIKIDGNEDVLFLYSTTMMEIPNNFKIIEQ